MNQFALVLDAPSQMEELQDLLAFDLGVTGHHRGETEVGADGDKAVVAAVAHTLESAGHHGQLRMSRKGTGAS
ncbi:hypothetical protein OHA25_13335 [Nonomuraea sp. NBC_00507]|uniref:hypothetical protein n=1 Tax=Nonomuraea sp. NBC_00507 TaxID=2976002 RepID=UPI002E199883